MQTNVRIYERDDHKNETSWNCHICTFVNVWQDTRCKMCCTNQKDEYTKGLESELQKMKFKNNALEFEIEKSKEELLETDKLKEDLKIKDEENIALKIEIQKLKEELLQVDKLKEQLYELECQMKDVKQIKQQKKQQNKQNNKQRNIMINTEQKDNEQKNEVEKQKIKIIFQGYMLLKNKLNSNYEKLWFLLYDNNTLTYYSNTNDAMTSVPLGKINLYLVINIKEQVTNNTFHIITPKRTYSLRVIDLEQYNQWVNIIKLSVSPRIICKGWLYKKKESKLSNKSWNLRYFILCHNYATKYHEMRYYEDERCNKYRGNINCKDIQIKDITFLPNDIKLKQYGKDLLLELTTRYRVYIFAAKDINSKCLWYESLKNIVEMPHISHSRNPSNSITIPSIPPTPKKQKVKLDYSHVNNNANNGNGLYAQKQLQMLAPISESGNGIVQQSNNNTHIRSDEWGDCCAELSSKMASPKSNTSFDSMDDSYNEDSYMKGSANPNEMSYMSQNTVMLLDINKVVKPGLNVDTYSEFSNSMDESFDIESPTAISMNSEQHYAPSMNQMDTGLDTVIHAPFNLKAVI